MRDVTHLILISALLAGLAGCNGWDAFVSSSDAEADAAPAAESAETDPPAAAAAPEPDPAAEELARLQAINDRLVEENRTLRAEKEDLLFENQEMAKCLDDTRDVILERNEQAELAEQLKLDAVRLDQQVKDLQAQVTVLEQLLEETRLQAAAE